MIKSAFLIFPIILISVISPVALSQEDWNLPDQPKEPEWSVHENSDAQPPQGINPFAPQPSEAFDPQPFDTQIQQVSNPQVEQLFQEAIQILRANAFIEIRQSKYEKACSQLEEATSLLEQAGQMESDLAKKVGAALFWTQKFLPGGIADDIIKAQQLAKEARSFGTVAPPTDPNQMPESKEMIALRAKLAAYEEGQAKFDATESLVQRNSDDPYICALIWYKCAEESQGSDFSGKAFEKAFEAHKKFAQQTSGKVVPTFSRTEGSKLRAEGEKRFQQDNFEEAIYFLQKSLEVGEKTPDLYDEKPTRYRLAHSFLAKARKNRHDLIEKLNMIQFEYASAFRDAHKQTRSLYKGTFWKLDPKYPPLVEADKKYRSLMDDVEKTVTCFNDAAVQFLKILKKGKDFDAAGHIGLCYSGRNTIASRRNAIVHLNDFITHYKPENDAQRCLYEYCKSELERMRTLKK